jgi:hypothetical protein
MENSNLIKVKQIENSSKGKEHQRKNACLGGISGKLQLGEG